MTAPNSLSADEIAAIVARVTYKPGFTLSVREDLPNSSMDLSIRVTTVDSDNRDQPWTGDMRVSQFIEFLTCEHDVLEWVQRAVHLWEHHEMHEWLRIDGEPIEDPHRDG